MKANTLTHAVALATTFASTVALADPQTRAFSFENQGSSISGTLYTPEGHDGSPLPTVVVTATVQQQMPATYALELAERGFTAVTFDFRGWGKSGDLPQHVRFKESPQEKISDIKSVFEYVATLPEVDPDQINGMGICASAGYMVDAVAGNDTVKRIGLVAPWLQNQQIVETVYGGAHGVEELIQVSRNAEAAGGQIIPAAGPTGTEGVLMPFDGYYVDPARGAITEYDNQWNQSGWEGWLTYYPADNPERLSQPLAIVHSEAAAIPQGVKTFLSGYLGDATLQMLEDVSQFDFYDNPEDVTRAADVMAEHFSASSNPGS